MSTEVSLPRGQRRRLKAVLRKTQSRIEALRCRVLLLHERRAVSEVATLVDCARATVFRAVYRHEELGEASIVDQRTRREAEKMTLKIPDRWCAISTMCGKTTAGNVARERLLCWHCRANKISR